MLCESKCCCFFFFFLGGGGRVMCGYALVMLGLCVLVRFYAKVSISFG